MQQLSIRRPNHKFFIFLLPFVCYIGYCLGTIDPAAVTLENIIDLVRDALWHPYPFAFSMETVRMLLLSLSVWGICYISHISSVRNYLTGLEYGSARIASFTELNRDLEDKKNGNKILSQNLRISMDTRYTMLNNNVLIVGGSGAGKSFFMVMPNGFAALCSYIFSDPKGELLRTIGNFLKLQGYRIVVLNLVNLEASDHYNPFRYIRSEADIVRLITNLIANTTPKEARTSDPFWEKSEGMYTQAIFLYIWYEYPKQGKPANFRAVLELLNMAKVSQKEGEKSELDKLMYALPEDHPALITYKKVVSGAADTIRSIIISAHARLSKLQNPKMLEILNHDDMQIPFIGEGVYENPERKTALFCVTPDNDTSYNFLVGLLYTQIFQELYYVADQKYNGVLPLPVAFWMDEFANTALPDSFCNLLSTMRSRNISCNIIIQNLAQLKTMFKDSWETIPGNCDTLVYLGGNEQSTHKYMSELLGKRTIDKRTTGESLGSHGSSSRNYDVLGRDLLSPDEVRQIDNKKSLIFVKGYPPVFDDKYQTWKTKEYQDAVLLGAYNHRGEEEKVYQEEQVTFFLDATGTTAITQSFHYQIEQYGGIFEETECFKKLTATNEGVLCAPESFGTYSYDEMEHLPAFASHITEQIESGAHILKKHAIIGCYVAEHYESIKPDLVRAYFNEKNRVIPMMKKGVKRHERNGIFNE